MRRRLSACLLVAAGALAPAGGALASNGGISPVGPQSPNAGRIVDAFWLILGITGAIFVLVEGALILFVVRYRRQRRPRNAEGPQVHGATRLETIWTVAPVVLLAVIVSFVFYKLPGIEDEPSAAAGSALRVKVEAHQFYWRFIYPDGNESINTLRVPPRRVVSLDLTSADVIHSWWAPPLGGKTDTIPGKVNHTWFLANHPGVYAIRCAEFCGIQHAAMRGFVDVTTSTEPIALGKQAVMGVCATCHGFRLEGLVGPAIAGNPTLNDPKGLRRIITQGTGRMPAVGKTWDDKLLNATIGYLTAHYGSSAGKTQQQGANGGG